MNDESAVQLILLLALIAAAVTLVITGHSHDAIYAVLGILAIIFI